MERSIPLSHSGNYRLGWNKTACHGIVPGMNWQIILADVVVFVHVLFVGFVVLAVPVILVGRFRQWPWVRNFWFRLTHLLMITIVVVETLCGVPCPLSIWERDLRIDGGQLEVDRWYDGAPKLTKDGKYKLVTNSEYDKDFVGRMLRRVIFLQFDFFTPEVLEVSYYLFGAMTLATFFLVPPRWPCLMCRRKSQESANS